MHRKRRMITNRGIGILSAAIACVLSATASQAAYVTYSATGLITEADNASQLPSALSTRL